MAKNTKATASSRTIEVNFEGVESGGGSVRVPEGDYALEIVKVVSKKGQESEKPYLAISFELSKGPKKGNGKVLPSICSLQQQALWNLRNLLESCGKTVPSKIVKLNLDKMVGWTCAGTVVDDEYEGRKKSIISAFFPIDDLGKTGDGEDLESGAGEDNEEGEESGEEEEIFS